MPEHRHKQRVRIVTDEAKYRRHRRKKLWRKLSRWSVWALLAVAGVLFIWLMLDKMQPPP